MQFDVTTDDSTDEATEAVAPGTSCVFPCGGVGPDLCTCPECDN